MNASAPETPDAKQRAADDDDDNERSAMSNASRLAKEVLVVDTARPPPRDLRAMFSVDVNEGDAAATTGGRAAGERVFSSIGEKSSHSPTNVAHRTPRDSSACRRACLYLDRVSGAQLYAACGDGDCSRVRELLAR